MLSGLDGWLLLLLLLMLLMLLLMFTVVAVFYVVWLSLLSSLLLVFGCVRFLYGCCRACVDLAVDVCLLSSLSVCAA